MKKIYEAAKVSAGRLVVELTEQSEIGDEELADLKHEYRSLGFQTALDDYGTGYSNVNNLLRYMPDYVKIDRALLANIQDSPQKQHLVKDIVTFAHDNNIMALAEGIETSREIETVIGLGVDYVQGYYTARPSEIIRKEIDPDIKAEIIKCSQSRHTHRQDVYRRKRGKDIHLTPCKGRIPDDKDRSRSGRVQGFHNYRRSGRSSGDES